MKIGNQYSVTIGIPVYNEEHNIVRLLKHLLKQKTDQGWNLKKILIYCDGSTDNTVNNIKKLNNTFVELKVFNERKGKMHRLNEMFKSVESDILVLFDADIVLADYSIIDNLVRKFDEDSSVKLVGGNSRALNPITFIERAAYKSFETFDFYRMQIKNGNNIFTCNGPCIAIKNELFQKIEFPEGFINEDDYIYLSCIKNNYQYKFAKDAVIFYRLPTTLKDYIKTRIRSNYQTVEYDFKKYFGNLINKETRIPLNLYFFSALKSFIIRPIEFITIAFINLYISLRLNRFMGNYKLNSYTANSTK